jgi:hypothetical protein
VAAGVTGRGRKGGSGKKLKTEKALELGWIGCTRINRTRARLAADQSGKGGLNQPEKGLKSAFIPSFRFFCVPSSVLAFLRALRASARTKLWSVFCFSSPREKTGLMISLTSLQ